jgi:hypothetical protein
MQAFAASCSFCCSTLDPSHIGWLEIVGCLKGSACLSVTCISQLLACNSLFCCGFIVDSSDFVTGNLSENAEKHRR